MATTTTSRTGSQSASTLENLTSAVIQSSITLLSKLQSQLNRVVPPERQESLKNQSSSFASRRPLIASLLISQLAFSGVPLLLFALLSIGALLFSLVTALVVGILVALLFTATCVGLGLLVLLPVLMVTTFLGFVVCGWGWFGWLVLKWFGKVNSGRGGDGGGQNDLKVEGKSGVENGMK